MASCLPSKLVIIDRQVALLPMLPDQVGVQPGFLLVRGRALVVSLVALFERTWETATPLRLTASGLQEGMPALDDVDVTLLTLMLSGLPDRTVAARLGTSERTAQRRLRRLMEQTGTTSRMQLGWHAARSGLIPT